MTRVETAAAAPVVRFRSGEWRRDALVLGIVAVLIRLPGFFATRSLVFDDGTFASSARAMRAGEIPFRDIFSSQGPVFLPLVWVGDLVGLRTMNAPRVLSVAAGVLVTIAVYACGRRLTTRAHSLLAAGLVTTSGSILWVTVPVNADGPALALSILAVALALRYRDDPRVATAVWMGLAAGAAVSIKALSVPAVVIAGLVVLLSHQALRTGLRDALLAAATALAVYVVAALPFGVGDVWEQSFAYHRDARRANSRSGALRKLVETLWDRDKILVVAVILAAIAFAVRFVLRRRAGRPGDRALTVVACGLVLWLVLVVALLVSEPAMWRAHVAHVIPPLALLAALKPPPWTVLVVAGLVTLPFAIAGNTSILWPDGYAGQEAALVQRLDRFPADAQFISDDPGYVWRSGHRVPGYFADPSYQRIDEGGITRASLVGAASDRAVCGVIVSSPLHFERFAGLADALAPEGFHPVRFGPHLVLYERDSPFCGDGQGGISGLGDSRSDRTSAAVAPRR
jgi:hypothetical protein